MDIRTVRRFLAVAELGSLNKASQYLNLSQPALSKSIRQLEEGLGVPLINRSPRGINLTTYGESVFEHARRISAELRKLESDIDAIRTLAYGEVNVGAPLGPDSRNIAISILDLIKGDRRISINIASGTRNELVRQLELGDLDFLITTLFEPEDMPPDIEQSELYFDSMILVVRAEHPILSQDVITLADLLRFHWVALVTNLNMKESFKKLIGPNFQHSLLHSSSPMFIKNILQRSEFVGLTRRDAVSLELQSGALVEINISDDHDIEELFPPQKVGLIHRSHRSLSTASQALIFEICNRLNPDTNGSIGNLPGKQR